MKTENKKFLILPLLLALALPGCWPFSTTTTTTPTPTPISNITLTMWEVNDDQIVFDPLIKEYTSLHPNVTISYRKMDEQSYEQNLINAMSTGEGPDIFAIHNDWLPKHSNKISPLPSSLMNINSFQSKFVDVTATDLIAQDNIYALPLYVDTLALYYNTGLLAEKGFSSPPITWEQLQNYVQKITQKDSNGNISLSGIPLGTANNVDRASDILYAMMLQNNTVMTNPDNSAATFASSFKSPTGSDRYPGRESLNRYTNFANSADPNYCWNYTLPNSVESFAKGYSAMTINYASVKDQIDRTKNPKVKYQIASLPQINTSDNPVSYASYWAQTVSRQSKNPEAAWEFLMFLSKDSSYNARSGRPTAQKADTKVSSDTFAKQAGYAKTFYKNRPSEIDALFTKMINDVSINGIPVEDAISRTQNDVTSLMIKYKK